MALGPYLTAEQAARYLGYGREDGSVNLDAFYVFARAHRIPRKHRGRRLLFRAADLDDVVEGRDLFVERALRVAAGGKR